MPMSLDQLMQKVRNAWYETNKPAPAQPSGEYVDAWVLETYEDHIIAGLDGKYYKVPFSVDGETVTLAARSEWSEVEEKREWVEVVKSLRRENTLVMIGEPVKSLGEGRFGGYLCRFTSADDPDLEGDFFDAATDFDREFPYKQSVYFNHAMDVKFGTRKLGKADVKQDEFGVWAEVILQERDEYEQFLSQLASEGKLGWSSGSASHLVKKTQVGSAYHIDHWPIIDASLTHTPAEARNSVTPLKSLFPAAPVKAHSEPATVKQSDPIPNPLEVTMTEPDEIEGRVSTIEGELKGLGQKLDEFLKLMQDTPAVRNAGYYTQDGGTADPNMKTFGDFLLAIKRKDVKRLHGVYGAIKDLAEDAGGTGGYIVPQEFETRLRQVAAQSGQIAGKVTRQPVGTDAGAFPILDQYVAPTAGVGDSALAGGVTATLTAEGGAYSETEPGFEQLKWRVNKIGGYTQVTNELRADSAVEIEGLLTNLFGIAVAHKEEYYILRGNGNGVPLGLLSWAGAIGISPDTNNLFAYADGLEMVSRFMSVTGGGNWLIHPSMVVDLGQWEIGTAGAGIPNMNDILGYGQPIKSNHLPQADNSGCVVLADLAAYIMFVRSGLAIAFSEHVGFLNGLGTWRFDERVDGMPWMKSYITLEDPQGSYTVSPVVYFND